LSVINTVYCSIWFESIYFLNYECW